MKSMILKFVEPKPEKKEEVYSEKMLSGAWTPYTAMMTLEEVRNIIKLLFVIVAVRERTDGWQNMIPDGNYLYLRSSQPLDVFFSQVGWRLSPSKPSCYVSVLFFHQSYHSMVTL